MKAGHAPKHLPAHVAASKEHNKKYKTGDATFYRILMKAFESTDTCTLARRAGEAIAL